MWGEPGICTQAPVVSNRQWWNGHCNVPSMIRPLARLAPIWGHAFGMTLGRPAGPRHATIGRPNSVNGRGRAPSFREGSAMYQLAARLSAARGASSCCTGISGAVRLGGAGVLDPAGPPLAEPQHTVVIPHRYRTVVVGGVTVDREVF